MLEINQKILVENLSQFTGTSKYYRITPKILLTDGTYYLAEQAGAFWLMIGFASHLDELNRDVWFAVLKLHVTGCAASLSIEDGNDNLLAKQEIECTDFPLPSISLYGCLESGQWVLMLPNEY